MLSTAPILAAFVTPALFYGGAAAVAAPILIHLLARRRFKRIRWAAMDFLIDAEKRNRRRIRMEEWILLALRCLAVLLIAAMIARPFIPPAGASGPFSGAARAERVFVLDDSLSTSYLTADGVVFDRSRTVVRRVLETVRRESPDDTVTLLRMTAPMSPIESGTFLDETQTTELLARLDALAPSQRSIDLASVVNGVVEVLERNTDIPNAAVYFISDFQRAHWGSGTERAAAVRGGEPGEHGRAGDDHDDQATPGLLHPLARWAEKGRGLQVFLINIGEDDAANAALTELDLQTGRLVASATGTVRARVANYSDRTYDNLELQVSVGNLAQPSETIQQLAPRQTTTADLDVEFLRSGYETVRVELPPDPLPADNVRHLMLDVAPAIQVLIVNGKPSSDPYDDEVTFLTTALRPQGRVFSGNEMTVIDETQFEDANLAAFHTVVLANVYRLSDPAVEALEGFVRQGGGLIVFLGDQVHGDLYNASLYREGDGLLPARLYEIRRRTDPARLVVTDRLHPVMRGLSREGDPLGIGQIPFYAFYASTPWEPDWPDENAVTSGPPAPSADRFDHDDEASASDVLLDREGVEARHRAARVVARFDDPDKSAAVVERRFGAGRVVLVTSSVSKEWNLWASHPTYLPVMMELVRHVARRSDTGKDYWVGDPIEVPLDPGLYEVDAVVRTPAFPNEREVGVTAAPASDGSGLALHWEHTDLSGVYQFVLRRQDGGETIRPAAVNVDPRESDLTMAEEEEIRRTVGDVPFTYIRGVEGLDVAAAEARVELWRFFLVAVVLTLLAEQSLAWWWGRKR